MLQLNYVHDNDCVHEAMRFQAKMAVCNVRVKYVEFFHFPAVKPTKSSDCIAKCKLCPSNFQTYKYNKIITTKGNLIIKAFAVVTHAAVEGTQEGE